MKVDPRVFYPLNVTDTCAVWNILSSRLLYIRATSSKCRFSCTEFVRYECLHKPRKSDMPGDQELCKRLRKEIEGQIQFQSFPLEIEDLQDIQTLQGIRMLSLGELSSIAFARKTQQAFLTDDQKARKLAEEFLGVTKVQTTPQLFGWLFFIGKLQDSEKNEIISEHSTLGRPLATFLEIMYIKALELRLAMESHGI